MVEMSFDVSNPFVSGVAGAIPALKVTVIPRGRSGTVQIGGPRPPVTHALLGAYPRLMLNGVELPVIRPSDELRFGGAPEELHHHTVSWIAPLGKEIISAIEESRTDDVSVNFACQFNYWRNPPGDSDPFEAVSVSVQRTLSQKEWLAILGTLGYGSTWVIEVPRPDVDGLEEAMKFVETAWTRIRTHDAAGAMSDLRKAWDRADTVLAHHTDWTEAVIDGLSRGEENFPPKSARIRAIKEAVDQLTQIGPHSVLYEVTAEDALLAYRLSVSTLAYVSGKSRDGGRRLS